MRVSYHPEFPADIKKFQAQYTDIAPSLGARFRLEVENLIGHIKASPGSGHFLNTGSKIVKEVRRRNLRSFPFFLLYGLSGDMLVFRSIIPSGSDPLTWLGKIPIQ